MNNAIFYFLSYKFGDFRFSSTIMPREKCILSGSGKLFPQIVSKVEVGSIDTNVVGTSDSKNAFDGRGGLNWSWSGNGNGTGSGSRLGTYWGSRGGRGGETRNYSN